MPAQSRADRRVDALSARTLLTASIPGLVGSVNQRRARAVADYQVAIFAAWSFAPILAFLWLWHSGNAARLRDLLRRRLRTRWTTRAAFGAVLGALATVTQAPFAFASHEIAFSVGLTAQSTGDWFLDELLRLALVSACTAAIVALVLALVDATHLWYAIFIGILYAVTIVVVAIEPVVLTPLVVPYSPAPAAIVAVGDTVAHQIGTAPVPIEIAATSRRTVSLTARAAGLGPFDRIVLGDATVGRLTPAELRFELARLYVDVRDHVVLSLTLIGTSFFVVSAALAVLISDRIGFRRDDDPLARLALLGTILGLVVLALYPAYNAVARGVHGKIDALAIASTHDPSGAVRLWVRRADDGLVVLCGRRSERWYFDARPPLGSSIAAARGSADPCAP